MCACHQIVIFLVRSPLSMIILLSLIHFSAAATYLGGCVPASDAGWICYCHFAIDIGCHASLCYPDRASFHYETRTEQVWISTGNSGQGYYQTRTYEVIVNTHSASKDIPVKYWVDASFPFGGSRARYVDHIMAVAVAPIETKRTCYYTFFSDSRQLNASPAQCYSQILRSLLTQRVGRSHLQLYQA